MIQQLLIKNIPKTKKESDLNRSLTKTKNTINPSIFFEGYSKPI
jgi:hypothetical protein